MKNKIVNFGLIAFLAISFILYNGFQTNKDSKTTFNQINPNNSIEIIEKVIPSVFAIYFDYNSKKPSVSGTGFLINHNNENIIVTNYHVVSLKNKTYYLASKDGTPYEAEVLYSDKEDDIAFLKIKQKHNTPYLKFIDYEEELYFGQPVFTIGNPYDFLFTLGVGNITNINKDILFEDGEFDEVLIQTDINVNPGNSGGPLFNTNGEVIGIISSTLEDSVGISFAIPSSLILEHLDRYFKL